MRSRWPQLLLFALLGCAAEEPAPEPAFELDASDEKPVDEDDPYYRVSCVQWSRAHDGTLAYDLINWRGGCGWDFELLDARLLGDDLDLDFARSCGVPDCGGAQYDLSFTITQVDGSRPLNVEVELEPCQSNEARGGETVTLPLDTQPEGIRCRYLDAFGFDYGCGGPRQPHCTADDLPIITTCDDNWNAKPCEDGTTCTSEVGLASGTALCLAQCETDDECTHDIESCQDGVCLLKEMF